MGLPGLSMVAQIDVEDKRLSIVLIVGYLLVFTWGIMNVFYHAEYFQYLPIAPVSQGGYVADDLGYDASSPCTVAQNVHCADEVGALCTVITPDEVVLGGTVYQDQLYITTKMDVLSHVKTCIGNVVQGMCVGVCSEEEADRLTLFTAGLEGLGVVNSHASKNPNAKDLESSTHHHCELKGSMALLPISSGPCADTTTSLAFDGGMGNDGTCYEGDATTVGQLLRNTDLGADADEQLLGSNGEIKPAVRDRCGTSFLANRPTSSTCRQTVANFRLNWPWRGRACVAAAARRYTSKSSTQTPRRIQPSREALMVSIST
jgi:hypothetical protein